MLGLKYLIWLTSTEIPAFKLLEKTVAYNNGRVYITENWWQAFDTSAWNKSLFSYRGRPTNVWIILEITAGRNSTLILFNKYKRQTYAWFQYATKYLN